MLFEHVFLLSGKYYKNPKGKCMFKVNKDPRKTSSCVFFFFLSVFIIYFDRFFGSMEDTETSWSNISSDKIRLIARINPSHAHVLLCFNASSILRIQYF